MKKILAVLLILTVVCCFVGCDVDVTNGGESSDTFVAPSDTSDTENASGSDGTTSPSRDSKPSGAALPSRTNVTTAKGCEHIWSQWRETVKPTCAQSGQKTRQCRRCAKEESASIAALSHKESDWIVDAFSTVDKEGKKHTECIHCQKRMKEVAIPKTQKDHKHSGAEYVITKRPDCDTDGIKALICTCGVTVKTDVLKATGHTGVTDKAVAASCYSTGLTEGEHCSTCMAIIVEQTVIPQKEHAFGAWQVMVEATETTTGIRSKRCSVCATAVTETIPAFKDADPSELNRLLYEWRDDGYWVADIQSCINPILTIPATYEGKAVVGIAEKAFYKNTVLEEVIIPSSVKACEYRAFYKCTSLKKVRLPDGLTTIPDGMFEGCSSLAQVNLPAFVRSIGSKAFASCSKLNLGTVTLGCSFGSDAFRGVAFDTLTVKRETVSCLGSTKIKKLVLAEGVKTLEKDALMWATVGEISFPSTLKTIKNGALYGVGVEKLVFNSAIHLEYGAFNNCRMREIVLPAGSTMD
ncbi:MAG: leucine-rich repeat protein, partial [Clostridia bacterium]|nr:leucine-rich repeat protein [Clostridia bacterium]